MAILPIVRCIDLYSSFRHLLKTLDQYQKPGCHKTLVKIFFAEWNSKLMQFMLTFAFTVLS